MSKYSQFKYGTGVKYFLIIVQKIFWLLYHKAKAFSLAPDKKEGMRFKVKAIKPFTLVCGIGKSMTLKRAISPPFKIESYLKGG
jgi:hypothetical protein